MKFLNAIGFLTIIRIPEKFYIKQQEYPKVLVYFPVTGFLIGLLSSIVFFSFNFIFPLILTIIIIVFFEIVITGGIHIDGIADTADGIFSGEKDRKKIFEIMKKGDVGVFGVLAIIFSVGFKIAFFYIIAAQLNIFRILDLTAGDLSAVSAGLTTNMKEFLPGFLIFLTIIIFTPVYGRLSMLYLFSRYEPAGKNRSLTDAFKDKSNRDIFILSTVYLSIIFIAASVITRLVFMHSTFNLSLEAIAFIYAIQSVLVIVLTMLIAAGAGRFVTKRTGGLSGDIIGAVCILAEISFLFLNYVSLIFL
jgi:adenosylcobinamide-GDP ribazoletransferase